MKKKRCQLRYLYSRNIYLKKKVLKAFSEKKAVKELVASLQRSLKTPKKGSETRGKYRDKWDMSEMLNTSS